MESKQKGTLNRIWTNKTIYARVAASIHARFVALRMPSRTWECHPCGTPIFFDWTTITISEKYHEGMKKFVSFPVEKTCLVSGPSMITSKFGGRPGGAALVRPCKITKQIDSPRFEAFFR